MPSTTKIKGVDNTVDPLKDKDFLRFHEYLKSHSATATMVSVALNLYRPSACRYKRWLEKDGHLFELGKGICAITGFRAQYLSTDESKKPVQPQLNLF